MPQHDRVTHVLYLHGFRSSPRSTKARQLAERVALDHPLVTWWCPQLPVSPRAAMDLVEQGIADWPRDAMVVVGSSLGGFYATWLAERLACRAVLLNPAVSAARDMWRHVGEHVAWHDPAQRLVLEPQHVDELRALQCAGPARPEHYFLLAAKGDAVLDWQEMVARYPGATVRLLEGSDHGLSDFDATIDEVMRFMDLA